MRVAIGIDIFLQRLGLAALLALAPLGTARQQAHRAEQHADNKNQHNNSFDFHFRTPLSFRALRPFRSGENMHAAYFL